MNSAVTQQMVADRVGKVRWHGRYFSMICPFHDDREPSLLVYRDGAYCMGCRKSYSLQQLWYKLSRRTRIRVADDSDYSAAIDWDRWPEPEELAEEAHSLLLDYSSQGKYLADRGISSRIDSNRLGWWDGYYTFPGYNQDWSFAGLVLRAGPETQRETGNRYLTPPGQPPFLYVTDWNRVERQSAVFVCFGVIDALVVATLGFASVSPSNGQTADYHLFESIRKRLVVVPDKGEVETAQNLIAELGWRGELLLLPYDDTTKDPADYIHQPSILTAHLARY